MKRIALVGIAIGGVFAAPVMAQTYTQPVVQRDTVPVQISQKQIKDLQRTLNRRGFSAGRVDGLWGPDTAAALKRFQSKNELNPTGELDRTTELKLGMVGPSNRVATPVAAPVVAPVKAPVATAPATPAAPVLPATPPAAVVLTPVTPIPAPTTASVTRQPKATSGANSFTGGQAHDRIQAEGFQNVRDLALDSSGIWRGMALKNGQPVQVWLDYQGDVGQQ